MKKIFKLFPVALAAFALASCSNENDYFAEDGTINAPAGSIIATVEDAHYEGGGVTRSALADFADGKYERVVWTDGDAFKLYARCNWRTDKFELTAAGKNNTVGVFECANEDGESHILAKDSAYAVFPYSVTVDGDGKIDAENGDETVTQMQDEERTTLDIFLPTAWTPTKITAKKAATDVTTETYTCPIPLWGFAWQNSDGTKNIKFKYLTAVLCVNVGSSMPTDAKTIVVEAADNGGGSEPIDVIAGAFEADVKDLMLSVWNKDIETEAEVDVKNVPDLYPSDLTGATTSNKIIVTLPAGVAAKSKFYIPVPAGKYHDLKVYFGKADGTILTADTYLRQFGHFKKDEDGKYTDDVASDGTVEGYYEDLKVSYYYDVNASAAVSANIPEGTFTGDNATIAKLNEYLQNLDYSADIDITVNDALTSKVSVKNKETVNDTLLVIPASTHKVNITFNKQITTASNTTGATTRPLAIKNQGATLTIAAADEKVISYVDVIGESTGTVVIGKNIATGTAAFKTWSPAAIDVNTEGTTAIASIDVYNASAAVTLTKGTVTALNVNAGTATIGSETIANTAGVATNVVLTTGTFNVNNLGATNPVASVTFKGAGTLNLWDGTVTNIYADTSLKPASSGDPAKYTGVGKATVNTFYNAVIGNVSTASTGAENDAKAIAKINFNAKWAKANATGTGATAKKTAAATTEVADIFTASQFAKISNGTGITSGYKLHTNIDFDGATWTPLALNKSLAGDTVTVQNFKVATTGANQKLGLFSTVTPAAAMEISHLTVKDVTADLKKDNNVYTLADAIGGVIGQVASSAYKLTLTDVHLKGTNTLGVNASTQSAKIGGLIGEAAGEVELANTSVEGLTINGYHSLGGLIGAAGANVTISNKNTAVTGLTINVKYSDNTADQDQNFGKVGGFIGTADVSKNITIGAASTNAIAAPSFTLNDGQFDKNWTVISKTGSGLFYQYYHKNQNYIGYSAVTAPANEGAYTSNVYTNDLTEKVKINNVGQSVKWLSPSAASSTSVANCLFYYTTSAE